MTHRTLHEVHPKHVKQYLLLALEQAEKAQTADDVPTPQNKVLP